MLKKMNPTVKRLWLRALRSGKYRQGRGYLRTRRNGYCCLGVLCDVYAKKHPTTRGWHRTEEGRWNFKNAEGSLPTIVKRWAGLDRYNPVLNPNGKYTSTAANCNDTLRWNFKRIAKAIQENL